ncbi:unnamed protein product [Vicia faba]|uniref:Uncharacterized protein n=1 Tax=Vicia faba TaxID=3906 RepID=A0AAV1A928_VICFA|nr:unnamed protein product [Vicia faba]
MVTQQKYQSVTLGEKKDQTSTSNFVSDFDRCPNAVSQNVPFFLALLYFCSCIKQYLNNIGIYVFCLCSLISSSLNCESLVPISMLLELCMGGISFLHNSYKVTILFLHWTSRRMALMLVWLAYNHSLVLAPAFALGFQPSFCLRWKTTLLQIFYDIRIF